MNKYSIYKVLIYTKYDDLNWIKSFENNFDFIYLKSFQALVKKFELKYWIGIFINPDNSNDLYEIYYSKYILVYVTDKKL